MATKRYIVGIYNYCDYWCDRCAFTQRCRNYVSERAERRRVRSDDVESLPDADATNAAFWDTLADQLRETKIFGKHEALDEPPNELGDADGPDDAWLAREEARREEQQSHPLVILSRDYRMQVHEWLKTADADLKAVAHSLREDAENSCVTDNIEEKAREIGNLIEVVDWYHTLIPTKLGRAVSGLQDGDNVGGKFAAVIAESRQSDANGSGKIALVSIERSIAAWLILRDILSAQEDRILAMLALLDRMRRRIQVDLPDSVTFRRPGFDGEDVGLFD